MDRAGSHRCTTTLRLAHMSPASARRIATRPTDRSAAGAAAGHRRARHARWSSWPRCRPHPRFHWADRAKPYRPGSRRPGRSERRPASSPRRSARGRLRMWRAPRAAAGRPAARESDLLGNGVPYGIRTRVAAVKGRCPRPLDEGDRPWRGVNARDGAGQSPKARLMPARRPPPAATRSPARSIVPPAGARTDASAPCPAPAAPAPAARPWRGSRWS
jgi:hypothetical protein